MCYTYFQRLYSSTVNIIRPALIVILDPINSGSDSVIDFHGYASYTTFLSKSIRPIKGTKSLTFNIMLVILVSIDRLFMMFCSLKYAQWLVVTTQLTPCMWTYMNHLIFGIYQKLCRSSIDRLCPESEHHEKSVKRN